MKTIVFAYHNIGFCGIEALIRNNFDIQAVFSHKDDSNENIWFNSVKKIAKNNNLKFYTPKDINSKFYINLIKKFKPEVFFSFYYRQILNKELLDIVNKNAFNLHGSLLPKYRGRCPLNWAIINGEKETGITLHYMNEKIDNGDIIGFKKIIINISDTAYSVSEKMVANATILLDEILPLIKTGCVRRIPQEHNKSTYYGGRTPEDGLIDWNKTAFEIYNLVRALTYPWPGAFTYINNEKIIILKAEIINSDFKVKPGTIIKVEPLIIACGKNALCIKKIEKQKQ